jgi:hypothetical protein
MEKTKTSWRSAAYPAIALGDALKRLEGLKSRLGINGTFNRETAANGIGYTSVSGASTRAVAALVHYGLLNRQRDNYSISDAGKSWLLPSHDSTRVTIERELAVKPKLFSQLYSEYGGQVIPKLLANRLVTQYSIQPNAAADVVRLFRESLRYAGMVDENDLILPPTELADSRQASAQEDQNSNADEPEATGEATVLKADSVTSQHLTDYLSFDLPSGLVISYPRDLATAFAFGEFGAKLRDLNDAVQSYRRTQGIADDGIDKD